MTTWPELRHFILGTFQIVSDEPTRITVDVPQNNDRSQIVSISYLDLPGKGGQWVVTQSALAEIATVDVQRALKEARNIFVGGIALEMGQHEPEFLVLRHASPIAQLNIDEFMQPLIVLANYADMLEKMLSGSDDL